MRRLRSRLYVVTRGFRFSGRLYAVGDDYLPRVHDDEEDTYRLIRRGYIAALDEELLQEDAPEDEELLQEDAPEDEELLQEDEDDAGQGD